MAEQIKTVMVLGGTGNLGPHVVSALSKADFRVSVLSRNPRASSTEEGVSIVQSDYTFDSLVSAFQGQDAVVCATAATNIADQLRIIDAAVAAKVKRVLPNEFGVDTSAEGLGEKAALFKAKHEVVAYLKEREAEGLSWTALCTGPWIDWGLYPKMLVEGQGLLGLDIRTKTCTLFDSGDQGFTATKVGKVGEAVAAVLLHPDETRNQHVQVNSFLLTQNLVLEALERVSGTQFAMERMGVAELLADGERRLAEGDWDGAYYKLVTAMVYSGHEASCFREKAAYWNGKLGLEQDETLDEMVGRVLAHVASP